MKLPSFSALLQSQKPQQVRPATFAGNNVKFDMTAADAFKRHQDKGAEIISSRHETDC